MKYRFLLIALIAIPLTGFSQVYSGAAADKLYSGANQIRLKPFTHVPDYISFYEAFRPGAEKGEAVIAAFFINPKLSLKKIEQFGDKLGWEHFRYAQTYDGTDIEFTQYIVHTKNGKVLSMNGSIFSNPVVSGSFIISNDDAVNAALDYTGAKKYMFETEKTELPEDYTSYIKPVAEAVYFPENVELEKNHIIAAYRVDVFSLEPYDRKWVYVNAENGEIITSISRIQTTDVPGTAQTAYSGSQTITTDYTGSYYRLRETGRGNGVSTYNCQLTTSYNSAIDFTDNDNIWNNANANLDQYATDAHFATERTYDYYYNVHGRNSINNSGFHLKSYVHFNLVEAGYSSNVNAFWNGECMTYGDGDETRTPLTTIDICAHEITHGLTSYTANLVYQNESGALNEAFSDIFGTVVEHYAAPDYFDWTIGEDIAYPFRSLSNPNEYGLPDTYQGLNWHTDPGSDNGGVHRNCGPLSYWFYLISEGGSGTNDLNHNYNISGIGMNDAADISYRLLTVYLTNTSNYADARYYGIQAAIDYFGACSEEVEKVTNSFYAIGVGDAYVPEVIAGFTSDYAENCSAPFTVQFYNTSMNASDFLWNFGDGTTSTEVNPEHTYNSAGNFNVSLSADGGTCGDDNSTITDFIRIGPEYPCLIFMPESGNVATSQCSGILYDIGGPSNPYYDNTFASYTIQPPGASKIILNINEFDIEPGSGSTCNYDYIAFYDGVNTSAPLINNTTYCNTNGNPGTIESTGGAITIAFYSDPGLSLQGFEIEWNCLQDNGSPLAAFSAVPTSSCSGIIQFTNESLNEPDSFYWTFGDGNNSSDENPTHLYNNDGNYTISLTVSNDFGENTKTKTGYIQVSLAEPPPYSDTIICIDSVFTLGNASGEAIHWYADEGFTDLVHTGATWEHEPISEVTSYWLRSFDNSETYYVGETQSNVGGGPFGNPSYIHYLVFDAYKPFTLVSVEVNADGNGERQIALRDAQMNTIETRNVYCSNGIQRIDINFNIPVGESLQLVGLNSPNLFRTNESAYLNYPYTIEDVCSIKYSSASQSPTGYYYYFYDWEILTQACESEPKHINITPIECTSSAGTNSIEPDITIYPQPTSEFVHISGLKDTEEYFATIFDASGLEISKKFILSNNRIDLSYFTPGLYIIRIETDSFTIYRKLIKS